MLSLIQFGNNRGVFLYFMNTFLFFLLFYEINTKNKNDHSARWLRMLKLRRTLFQQMFFHKIMSHLYSNAHIFFQLSVIHFGFQMKLFPMECDNTTNGVHLCRRKQDTDLLYCCAKFHIHYNGKAFNIRYWWRLSFPRRNTCVRE